MVQQSRLHGIKLSFRRGKGHVLHGGNRVAIPDGHFLSWKFKKSQQSVPSSIKEIVTQILKGRIPPISWPNTYAWRHSKGMDQGHAQNTVIKLGGCLHVRGVQRQVVNASRGGF